MNRKNKTREQTKRLSIFDRLVGFATGQAVPAQILAVSIHSTPVLMSVVR